MTMAATMTDTSAPSSCRHHEALHDDDRGSGAPQSSSLPAKDVAGKLHHALGSRRPIRAGVRGDGQVALLQCSPPLIPGGVWLEVAELPLDGGQRSPSQ
ncbi:hypothetical protein GUJ93_ZPchr0011g28535 [Zizania palustris]|uniref:Uncharacterized protein n=1 Tax=Zizania palustris TaxID=103762 RepID=A0A8J5WHG6_ZIZPA|nr:hypothetical protein GUJ93_ZPchr0011g28535 [Zizania palustris]